MAQLGVNFNAATVAPYEPAGAVWEGRVPMVIMKTEIKDTNAQDGQKYLALEVQALDMPYKGQTNTVRLNLYNRNPQAVDIAQRQLSSICHVTGRMAITDSDQLIGAPFIGIWEKQSREVTDQATGVKRMVEGCQCNNFHLIDGRTIKEATAGQAASNPYIPGQSGVQEAAMRSGGGAPAPQHNPAPAPAPAPAPQAGFQQGPAAAPQAGVAAAGGPAPAPAGPQQHPTPGFGTAASGSNGFAPPAPAAAPQGGFAPPAPGGAAPGGFAPPAGPQAGPGPWAGAGAAAPGGFGVR